MKKSIISIIVLFAFSGVLSAQYYTGNTLLAAFNKEGSSDRNDLVEWSMAFGYIIGVHDSYDGEYFDSPAGVNSGQLMDIVKNYLEKHPEDRHMAAALLVVIAFNEAFPTE